MYSLTNSVVVEKNDDDDELNKSELIDVYELRVDELVSDDTSDESELLLVFMTAYKAGMTPREALTPRRRTPFVFV